MKIMTELPHSDVLDVTPQDGLEVTDEDGITHVNRAVLEVDPIT